jgi:hypothetical protein
MRPIAPTPPCRGCASLACETLEDRTLPAGNVTALVSAGILNVVGDDAANRVLVAATGEHTFVLTSLDGSTTLNGGTGPVQLDGVNAINVQMRGGDDFVHVTGTRGGLVVYADTGAGDDGLAVTFARHEGMTSLNTGAGDDVVSIGASEFEALVLVNVGAGDNQVYLAGCEFDDSAIGGVGGRNQLGLLDVDFDRTPMSFGFQTITGTLMPLANDDAASVRRTQSVTIDVAANDAAVTGSLNQASVRITSQPTSGTARVNADGTVTYTAGASGNATTDTFRYTIQNSAGGVSNEATVTVSLLPAPDTAAPVPTITTTATNPTGQSPIPFRVVFSEAVTGFVAGDVSVTNGAVSGFTAVNPRTYTFNVAPAASGTVRVTLAAGAAWDASGNASTAATLAVTADRTRPSVTLATTADDPTNVTAIPFTATFTEDVADFVAGDIVVTNGSVATFSATNARTYTFTVTPAGDGTVTVAVNAGVAHDTLGNGNTAATPVSVVSDRSPPTAAVTSASDPTGADPILFTVTFNEDVAGLPPAALSATNGTVGTITLVNARTFTVAVAPSADGPVTLTVLTGQAEDLAGNATAADFSLTLTSDATDPTVGVATSSTGSVAGTSSDATSGVAGVGVSVSDGTNFWDGTGFTSATEVFHTATSGDGFATWSYTLAATGTLTVRARATDGAGNVGEATESVTVS